MFFYPVWFFLCFTHNYRLFCFCLSYVSLCLCPFVCQWCFSHVPWYFLQWLLLANPFKQGHYSEQLLTSCVHSFLLQIMLFVDAPKSLQNPQMSTLTLHHPELPSSLFLDSFRLLIWPHYCSMNMLTLVIASFGFSPALFSTLRAKSTSEHPFWYFSWMDRWMDGWMREFNVAYA